MVDRFGFGQAIDCIKGGDLATRKAWMVQPSNEPEFPSIVVGLDPVPSPVSTTPFLYWMTPTQESGPWTPTNTDLLAEDWGVVKDGTGP